jgi:uncharacterized protein (TIGR02996 family)
MARYERDGEFWDFTRDGTTITTVTGKLGEAGTTTVEQLASAALAVTRERVLLNKQARDGWKIYKPPVAPPASEPSLPPPPVVFDARNPELERAILEDPENHAVYEVYGDWLQSQGDPRGKLIALELACVGKPYGDKHHAAKARWEAEHRDYLFGGIGTHIGSLFLGFVNSIAIREGELADQLEAALASPASRFVTRIALDCESGIDGGAADLAAAIELVGEQAPKTLRSLEVGGSARLKNLDAIAKRLPELRQFAIASVGSRELTVDAKVVKTIVRSPWPRLESLTLELVDGTEAADVEPLFARTDLPKLKALYLRTPYDAELVTALLAGPLAAQLEELGISYFGDDDADARAMALIEGLPELPRLTGLQLPLSRFSSELNTRLDQLPVKPSDGDEARFDSGYE